MSEEQKLTATDAEAGDLFGLSVDVGDGVALCSLRSLEFCLPLWANKIQIKPPVDWRWCGIRGLVAVLDCKHSASPSIKAIAAASGWLMQSSPSRRVEPKTRIINKRRVGV